MKKRIKLTFEYDPNTKIKSSGVFNEDSDEWGNALLMLNRNRHSLERSGSLGGNALYNLDNFVNTIPELKNSRRGMGMVSEIEIFEEDEDGNKTEPKKLKIEDFPKEIFRGDNSEIEDWFFKTKNQNLNK